MIEGERPTLLVADDDEDVLELVTLRLERSGYPVTKARDGHEALRVARQEIPALVVLDLMLPGMTGYEVTHALREGDLTRDIRIIMLTARVQDSDVRNGFAAGADAYVAKPFSAQELLARIESTLSPPAA